VILALQSTTFGVYGGIPTYNRLICRALNDFLGAFEKRVLIATDSLRDVEPRRAELPYLGLEAFARKRNPFVFTVLKLGLTKGIDLALIGHVNYAPLGWMLKQMQPSLRYGVIIYGIDAWQTLGGVRGHALRNADFIISISDFTAQKAVAANGLAAGRIHLLPNALEWTEATRQNTPVPPSAIKGTMLLSVCRLDENERYKGVDKVIEALPEVARKVPNVQYLVVGGGTDLERHKELALSCGVSERVHFLGFVDDDSLRACYRDCDLFVLPSAGEGFGFVFLEAMKYGKAIVAANSGGAPEVVVDGLSGRLVEYGDREQLPQTLTDLCLDAEKRREMGQAGHTRLVENYTYEHFKERFDEIMFRELPAASLYRGRREVLNAA